MNSAINIEYVYLILTSINNFMQIQQETIDNTLTKSVFRQSIYVSGKKNNEITINMKQLKMKNLDNYDITHKDSVAADS